MFGKIAVFLDHVYKYISLRIPCHQIGVLKTIAALQRLHDEPHLNLGDAALTMPHPRQHVYVVADASCSVGRNVHDTSTANAVRMQLQPFVCTSNREWKPDLVIAAAAFVSAVHHVTRIPVLW